MTLLLLQKGDSFPFRNYISIILENTMVWQEENEYFFILIGNPFGNGK